MAYQQEGDIVKARAAVADLRAHIFSLPTSCGINKHFRIEQAEAKALSLQPTITESSVNGESHD